LDTGFASERALTYYDIAFSSRHPVSTSVENALEYDSLETNRITLQVLGFHRIFNGEPVPTRVKSGAGLRRTML
jgi:hypothetical protein